MRVPPKVSFHMDNVLLHLEIEGSVQYFRLEDGSFFRIDAFHNQTPFGIGYRI